MELHFLAQLNGTKPLQCPVCGTWIIQISDSAKLEASAIGFHGIQNKKTHQNLKPNSNCYILASEQLRTNTIQICDNNKQIEVKGTNNSKAWLW